MKLSVYDFFDAFEEAGGMAREPSQERIMELTMKKIENEQNARKPVRKFSLAAAAVAAVFLLSIAGFAAGNWTGFLSTGSLSQRQLAEMMEQVQHSGKIQSTDSNGNVHYFDGDGDEIMVLTPAEARQFEQAMEEKREQENREAAGGLIDIDTLPQEPRSITLVPTDDEGNFEDFLLGNGSMVILHSEGSNGYELHAGDVVTITMDASADCIMEFGMFLNGRMLESETTKAQVFSQEFTVPEDGVYCFTLMYFSSDCDQFTNCGIRIQTA